MPGAYKDVSDALNVMHQEGITKKVAKQKPVGVIKFRNKNPVILKIFLFGINRYHF